MSERHDDFQGDALLTDLTTVPHEQIPATLAVLEQAKALLWARLHTANIPAAKPAEGRVTQEEAAHREGIELPVVRYLTRTGRVPSIQEGKSRKLYHVDLAAYVQRCAALGVSLRKGPAPLVSSMLHGVTSRP
jgi:hypothetical protein